MVKLILEQNGGPMMVTALNNDGIPPHLFLDVRSIEGPDIMKLLIKHGADIDIFHSLRKTLLIQSRPATSYEERANSPETGGGSRPESRANTMIERLLASASTSAISLPTKT